MPKIVKTYHKIKKKKFVKRKFDTNIDFRVSILIAVAARENGVSESSFVESVLEKHFSDF